MRLLGHIRGCGWASLLFRLGARFLMFGFHMWVYSFVHAMDLWNCHPSSLCSSPCHHAKHSQIIRPAQVDEGNGNYFIGLTAVGRHTTEIICKNQIFSLYIVQSKCVIKNFLQNPANMAFWLILAVHYLDCCKMVSSAIKINFRYEVVPLVEIDG